MICAQFAVSSLLIIAALTMERQIQYMRTNELGFDGDQVASLVSHNMTASQVAVLRDRLDSRYVESVSGVNQALGYSYRYHKLENNGESIVVLSIAVEPDFVRTLGLRLAAGRDFSPAYATDQEAVLVNQRMAALLGPEPVGTTVAGLSGFTPPPTVIGVVEDFHIGSMRSSISPVFIYLQQVSPYRPHPSDAVSFEAILVRLKADHPQAGIEHVRQVWAATFPERELSNVRLLAERFADFYREEERWANIFAWGSAVTVVIACMGLVGLAAQSMARQTREIGIRRVLGASLVNLLVLLAREFAWLVLAGSLIAWPLAWLGTRRWLETFAYRIEPEPGLFILSTLGLLGLALCMVAGHVLRTARTPPVEALRYE